MCDDISEHFGKYNATWLSPAMWILSWQDLQSYVKGVVKAMF